MSEEIAFQAVKTSDTLDSVAFYPEFGDLLIRFRKSNAVYLYRNADAHLAKLLVSTPHPWSKFGPIVKELQYEKISSGLRTEPLKRNRIDSEPEKPKVVVSEKPARKAAHKAAPKVTAQRPTRTKKTKVTDPANGVVATIKAEISRRQAVLEESK